MNKLIAVLTAVVSLAFAGPAAHGEGSFKLLINDNVVMGYNWVEEGGDVDEDGWLAIPDGVVEIAEDALTGMEGVVGVEIPDGVRTIGPYAFSGCEDLAFVDGGNGLVSVGEFAFEDTPFICGVETSGEMEEYDDETDESPDCVWVGDFVVGFHGRGALWAKYEDSYDEELDQYDWDYELGLCGCVGVADYALQDLPITSLVFDDSLVTLGAYAFAGCETLKYVEGIPESVEVEGSVFEGTPYVEGWECVCLVIEDDVVVGWDEWGYGGDVDEEGLLVIPDGVVEIAEEALCGMEGVVAVEIPDSVRTIGAYAFAGCSDLASVDGGYGLVSVGEGAFEDTPFIYGVETMDDYDEESDEFDLVWVGDFVVGFHGRDALWNECETSDDWDYELDLCGCVGVAESALRELPLTKVIFDDSLVTLGAYAFADCETLKYVEGIPESVDVDESVFEGTPYVEGWECVCLVIEDGVVVGWDEWGYGDDVDEDGWLAIPDGVVEIAEEALCGMEGVVAVEIPDSVRTIGAGAFAGCSDLASVDGGYGLVSVGEGAFEDTPFIYGVETMDDYDEESDEFDLVWVGDFVVGCHGRDALWAEYEDSYDEELDQYDWDYEMDLCGCVGVADYALQDLPITSLVFDDFLVTLGVSAFADCETLKYVEGIPESVDVDESVFEGVPFAILVEDDVVVGYLGTVQEELVIPNGVTGIADGVFRTFKWEEESELQSVELPESMEYIGAYAFAGNRNLESVTFLGEESEVDIDPTAFRGTPYDQTRPFKLIIEDGVLLGSFGGADIPARLEIPEGVVAVGEDALCGVCGFNTVVLPSTLKEVGPWAFESCETLNAVEGSPALERVGWDAFSETPFAYGIDSFEGLDDDDWRELDRGLHLASVNNFIVGRGGWLEEAWDEKYGDADSEDWTWAYDLVIPAGAVGLADGLLDSLPVTSLTVPGSLKRIPEEAFSYLSWLKQVVFGEGVESIGYFAFGEDYRLTAIDLPASMRRVGNDVFEGCDALERVTFRSENTVFDSAAFRTVLSSNKGTCEPTEVVYGVLPGLKSIAYVGERLELKGWQVMAQPGADKSKEGTYPADSLAAFSIFGYDVTPILGEIKPVIPEQPVVELEPVVAEIVTPTGDFTAPAATTDTGVLIRDGIAAGVLQVKVGKASKTGESKVSVTVIGLDGKKYTAKAVKIQTGGTPTQTFEVKKLGTLTLTFGANGFSGTLNGEAVTSVDGTAATTPGKATFGEADFSSLPGVQTDYLPKDETVTRTDKKWTVAAKAGKLKYVKPNAKKNVAGGLQATGTNIAGLKLTYAPKTQTFKGSFKVWTFDPAKNKLKSVSAKVTGVVVNGAGYGEVTVKKVIIGTLTVR